MLELFWSPRRAMAWFIETSLLSLLGVVAAATSLGWTRALAEDHILRVLVLSALAQASMYYHGLYGPTPPRAPALIPVLLRALAVPAVAVFVLFHLMSPSDTTPRVFVGLVGGAVVVVPAFRTVYRRLVTTRTFREPILVVGSGQLALACETLVNTGRDLGMCFAGVVTTGSEPVTAGLHVVGHHEDLLRLVQERSISRIVVAMDQRRRQLPVDVLLDLKLRGVAIEEGVDFYERHSGRVFVLGLRPSDVIFSRAFRVRRWVLVVKRLFDVVAATVGLVLAAPIMAVTAVAIWLDSPGPVIYSQVRTGALGCPFLIRKFRSMRTDAETAGALWAQEHDPRATRVGRFIRRCRIDELPQLWNVFTGEMSLVGPRPERPEFLEELEKSIPFFRLRLAVKPGVTGHAQVRCRYGASVEDAREKLEYDLFYLKRMSLLFDLSILVDTVKVVLLRIGSR